MNITVGTAGHIDHGKTSLVRALTGTDADRLPEEKRRGITIDLGFATLELGDLRIGFVDVPGHERFVKNMLAGAAGIDLVLLTVAADEGVMPQTREHFEICRLLGIATGIVVITKRDLVDEETLELAQLDAAELVAGSFLEKAPVIAISSKTGAGIDRLKNEIGRMANVTTPRPNSVLARLPIDRSFTVKGFGTVVTGTLAAGSVRVGDELRILPAGRAARVRGLQSGGRAIDAAVAGQRTALNLAGIDHDELSRGMVVAQRGVTATSIINASVEALATGTRPLRSRQRVKLHIGAAETAGRVSVIGADEIAAGESGFAQIRLDQPIVAFPGDKFIIRGGSPLTTAGGGEVIDTRPRRYRRRDAADTLERLALLQSAIIDPTAYCRLLIESAAGRALSLTQLCEATGRTAESLTDALAEATAREAILQVGELYVDAAVFAQLKARSLEVVRQHHAADPLSQGISRETLRERVFASLQPAIFEAVLAELQQNSSVVAENEFVRLAAHAADLSSAQKRVLKKLREIYAAGFTVPKLADALNEAAAEGPLGAAETRKLFETLVRSREIVKISEDFYFAGPAVGALVAGLRQRAAAGRREIDVAEFKQIAGLSRKYAIPLLEYFDREKITMRSGDKRRITPSAPGA